MFILAGQSNMVGTGGISTFDYLGDDPETSPLFKEKRGPNGEPAAMEEKGYLAWYRAELISSDEETCWKRAASIGGFVHYYG